MVKLANKRNLSRIGILLGLLLSGVGTQTMLSQNATQVPPRPGVVGQRDETKPRKCTRGVGNPVWGQLEPWQIPQDEKPHPCCYCHCHIKDYHKNCHKLCKLPPSSEGKVRGFNKIEDGFCVEVCMLKKEGKEHLKHDH